MSISVNNGYRSVFKRSREAFSMNIVIECLHNVPKEPFALQTHSSDSLFGTENIFNRISSTNADVPLKTGSTWNKWEKFIFLYESIFGKYFPWACCCCLLSLYFEMCLEGKRSTITEKRYFKTSYFFLCCSIFVWSVFLHATTFFSSFILILWTRENNNISRVKKEKNV